MSEDGEERKVRKTMPTYTGFVAASLNKIFAISIEGNIYDWYKAIQNFSLFIPEEVKKQVDEEFAKARKDVDDVLNKSDGADFYTKQVSQNRNLTNLLAYYAPRLTDLVVNSLDKAGYLKEEYARISSKSLKDLRELGEEEEK